MRRVLSRSLRVNVMASEIKPPRAVETATAQHELHVRVRHAGVPDNRGFLMCVKIAIDDVTPTPWANEIHPAAETATSVIIEASFASPQRHRVRAVAQHVAIHDHDAGATEIG